MGITIEELLQDIKKNKSHANRGKELERRIERHLKELSMFPNFSYIRLEIKQSGGKFLKKQPYDFLVIAGNKVIAFDTKQTRDSIFYFSKVPQHQLYELKKLSSMGHTTGFVVWFQKDDPTGTNLRLIEDFGKNATIKDGTSFIERLKFYD